MNDIIIIIFFIVFHLQNKSLPWDYQFKFVIDEISNINDKTQVHIYTNPEPIIFVLLMSFQSMMVSMYFAVSWLEPRLQINATAQEWIEDRTGPKDVSRIDVFLRGFSVFYRGNYVFTASK